MPDRIEQFEEFAKECGIARTEFADLVRQKRVIGHETYGDASYQWSSDRLLKEVVEECVDVMGWSSILFEVAKESRDSRVQDLAISLSRSALVLYERIRDEKETR